MDQTEKEKLAVRKLLRGDAALLGAFLLAALGVGAFVFINALAVTKAGGARTALIAAFAAAMLSLGGSMAWVLLQLSRNRDEAYGDELKNRPEAKK